MKPLKGELSLRNVVNVTWRITIPGRAMIISCDWYAGEKSAIKSAKRFAARCNIELEVDRETH